MMAVTFQLLFTGQLEDKAFHRCFFTQYSLQPLIKSANKTNKQKRSCEFFSLAVIMQLIEGLIKNQHLFSEKKYIFSESILFGEMFLELSVKVKLFSKCVFTGLCNVLPSVP